MIKGFCGGLLCAGLLVSVASVRGPAHSCCSESVLGRPTRLAPQLAPTLQASTGF